ncbi:MAG: hypothetical protein B7Z78_02095 [Rhodospirillales bacterium 20-60-12]|jgi:YggT family protein|nr:MAG: hypothetical protein B7Z78_02095 [Rhodospirillales bacterium 20-60-12]OYV62535.1 MAG: hypothetical protein B7X01_01385 [Acidiphilium sp. 21-62-4]HQT66847.1 YggT family protein [Acetobacteraceae bacterium]
MLDAVFWLVGEVIHLMILAIIIAAVFSMLASFGVLDTRNRIVYQIGDFFYRVTEPVLGPIRRLVPLFGNIDISPIIAILLLEFTAYLLAGLHLDLLQAGVNF